MMYHPSYAIAALTSSSTRERPCALALALIASNSGCDMVKRRLLLRTVDGSLSPHLVAADLTPPALPATDADFLSNGMLFNLFIFPAECGSIVDAWGEKRGQDSLFSFWALGFLYFSGGGAYLFLVFASLTIFAASSGFFADSSIRFAMISSIASHCALVIFFILSSSCLVYFSRSYPSDDYIVPYNHTKVKRFLGISSNLSRLFPGVVP